MRNRFSSLGPDQGDATAKDNKSTRATRRYPPAAHTTKWEPPPPACCPPKIQPCGPPSKAAAPASTSRQTNHRRRKRLLSFLAQHQSRGGHINRKLKDRTVLTSTEAKVTETDFFGTEIS